MIFSKAAIPAIMAFTSVTSAATTFSNMLIIMLENIDYNPAIADPNLKAFASSGVLFSNWDAIAHPSQPNYIATTCGSTDGITSDSTTTINVKNIADLLEAKGLTWKSYQENWPGNCFTGTESTDGLYFRLVNRSHPCIFINRVVFYTGSTTRSSATRIFRRTRHVALRSSMLHSLLPIFPRDSFQHLLGTR
jgi:hypothetical protein